MVDTIGLDDRHVVPVDGEVVVRLARYVYEAESISVARGTSVRQSPGSDTQSAGGTYLFPCSTVITESGHSGPPGYRPAPFISVASGVLWHLLSL